MDFNEVKSYIEQNAQSEEVSNYIKGLVTPDRVSSFLDTEEGKKILQPKIDSHFTKGLDTWKNNNLEKLINDEIAKRNPQETPEQKQIRELTERLNKKEADEKRQVVKNHALTYANGKKLPVEIIDFFLGDNEENTTSNLTKLEEVLNKHITAAVEDRLKNGYKPPTGDKSDEKDLLVQQVRKSLNGGI